MAAGDGDLLTVAQAKAYLNIEHSDDDTLLGDLIGQAERRMEAYIGTPINATSYTEYHDGGLNHLFLEHAPIKSDSVTITDTKATSEDATDDETVDAEDYRVRFEHGMITRTTSHGRQRRWDIGVRRFKVVYEAGLDQLNNWSTVAKEELRGTIRDLVSDWYERRIPTATREDMAFGVSKSYQGFRGTDLPTIASRVLEVWQRYRHWDA